MNSFRLLPRAWQRILHQLSAPPALRRRVAYSARAALYSALSRLQDASYADRLQNAQPKPPFFLLGFWRSGTTFLHELFCCDPRFGFPSTYACLNPSHFLLSERWANQYGPRHKSVRPMDNVSHSWSSPQEDEFALLALGTRSPYEAFLAPSLMRSPQALLEFESLSKPDQDYWQQTFLHLLRLLTVQQQKPMVLKSPPHGFRLSTLASMFPDAKYVLIERNPYAVFASNLKLWRTLIEMYGLEPYSPEDLESFVLSAYVAHEQAIQKGKERLAPRSFAQVRYEDLVANPLQQMSRLYSELELEHFDAVRGAIEQHLLSVKNYVPNHYRLSDEHKWQIRSAWGPILESKQYQWNEQLAASKG